MTLGGCFYSETSLIGYWSADKAIEPGVYTHTPYDENGAEWDRVTWQGEITYGGRRYHSEAENFPHEGARLHQLDGDIYIAEWPRDGGYAYGILFLYEGMASYHQPACDQLSEAARTLEGLILNEEGFCALHDDDQLDAVMRAYLAEHDGDIRLDGIYRRVENR